MAYENPTLQKSTTLCLQKQLIGRKKISSTSASANGSRCVKVQSATIQTGKTYEIEVSAQVYYDGAWHDADATITAKT